MTFKFRLGIALAALAAAALYSVTFAADASQVKSIWRIEILSPGVKVGEPVELISSPQGDWNPHFSPANSKIVFESLRGVTRQNWVADADGSGAFQLTEFPDALAGTPRWSSDGKFVASDSTDGEIYVNPDVGGAATNVTNNPARDVIPSWSRDGNWIYFASNRTGPQEIWKTSTTGGDAFQVTRNGGQVAHESPDGKWLYFTKPGDTTGLWRALAAGGPESRILDSVVYRAFAVTSGGIYFLSKAKSEGAILSYADLTGSEQRQLLTLNQRLHNGFSVSPDERFIIYSRVGR